MLRILRTFIPRTFIPTLLLTGLAAAEPSYISTEDFEALLKQGRDLMAEGRIAEAEVPIRQACPAASLPALQPARRALCYNHLGSVTMKGPRLELAPDLYLSAIDGWHEAGPAYDEARGYTNLILSDLYQRRQQPLKAEAVLTGLVEELRKAGKQSADQYPSALSRLALTYAATGRPALALTTITEALDRFGKLTDNHDAEAAYAYNTLGMICLSLGRQTEAEAGLRRAVQLAGSALGDLHPDTIGYQTNYALALIGGGDIDAAETLLRRARYGAGQNPGLPANQLGMISAELSVIALKRNKPGIAKAEGEKALALLTRQQFPDPRSIALAQVNLADVHLHGNHLAEAESLLDEAIPAERRTAPESRLLADGLRRLAQLRAVQGRLPESRDLYREAIAIYEARIGGQAPVIVPLLREYADVLKREGLTKAEARGVEARAKSIQTLGTSGFAPAK